MYTFKEYNYKSPATELRRSLSLQASSKQRRRRRRPSSDREEISSGNMLCGLYTSCGLFASSRPLLDTHINIYQSFAHFYRFYTFHHATLGLSSLFCPLTSVIAEVDSTGQSLYISGQILFAGVHYTLSSQSNARCKSEMLRSLQRSQDNSMRRAQLKKYQIQCHPQMINIKIRATQFYFISDP